MALPGDTTKIKDKLILNLPYLGYTKERKNHRKQLE